MCAVRIFAEGLHSQCLVEVYSHRSFIPFGTYIRVEIEDFLNHVYERIATVQITRDIAYTVCLALILYNFMQQCQLKWPWYM